RQELADQGANALESAARDRKKPRWSAERRGSPIARGPERLAKRSRRAGGTGPPGVPRKRPPPPGAPLPSVGEQKEDGVPHAAKNRGGEAWPFHRTERKGGGPGA